MVTTGATIMRRLSRVCSVRKCLWGLVCVSGLYLLSTFFSNKFSATRISYQLSDASLSSSKQSIDTLPLHVLHGDKRDIPHSISRRVLLLYDPVHLGVSKRIQALLVSHRVSYDLHTYSSLPSDAITSDLQTLDHGKMVGRYCLIICAGLYSNLQHYRDYSNEFNVTIVSFVSGPVGAAKHSMEMGVVSVVDIPHSNVTGVRVNPNKDYYYLKTGEWVTDFHGNYRWSTFGIADAADSFVEILASIRCQDSVSGVVITPLVLASRSRSGRGAEVLFGSSIEFWLSQLLLLEVLKTHPSLPILRFGRKRWVMIDIDDIFVAPEGLKMSVEDVQVAR